MKTAWSWFLAKIMVLPSLSPPAALSPFVFTRTADSFPRGIKLGEQSCYGVGISLKPILLEDPAHFSLSGQTLDRDLCRSVHVSLFKRVRSDLIRAPVV